MNKELEALLLCAAKATGRGVVDVDPKRARAFGVPVGHLCAKGSALPDSANRVWAETTGYYCAPHERPIRGECLVIRDNGWPGGPKASLELHVLREDGTGLFAFNGRLGSWTLGELKAYLRGIADGAEVAAPPEARLLAREIVAAAPITPDLTDTAADVCRLAGLLVGAPQ